MIRKDKVKTEIDKIIDLKKNLIPLLDKHIASSLPFSSLSQKEKELILEKFRTFVVTQSKHLQLLSDIAEEIKRSSENVF